MGPFASPSGDEFTKWSREERDERRPESRREGKERLQHERAFETLIARHMDLETRVSIGAKLSGISDR